MFCTAYLNNILVYSDNEKDHKIYKKNAKKIKKY